MECPWSSWRVFVVCSAFSAIIVVFCVFLKRIHYGTRPRCLEAEGKNQKKECLERVLRSSGPRYGSSSGGDGALGPRRHGGLPRGDAELTGRGAPRRAHDRVRGAVHVGDGLSPSASAEPAKRREERRLQESGAICFSLLLDVAHPSSGPPAVPKMCVLKICVAVISVVIEIRCPQVL